MKDDVSLTVRFGADEPLVEFPNEGVTISVPLTALGDDLFRLDGIPIMVESASFGDVIWAEPTEGGHLRFVRVAEPGGWRTYNYILPPHRIDSDWGQALLAELTARGGNYERLFGGLLFVCVPPGVDLDIEAWAATV